MPKFVVRMHAPSEKFVVDADDADDAVRKGRVAWRQAELQGDIAFDVYDVRPAPAPIPPPKTSNEKNV